MPTIEELETQKEATRVIEREAWYKAQAAKEVYTEANQAWAVHYNELKRLDQEIAIEQAVQARLEGADKVAELG